MCLDIKCWICEMPVDQRFKPAHIVNIFSSENILTKDLWFLRYLRIFLHLYTPLDFMVSMEQWLGILVYDLRPRLSCTAILIFLGSTCSSAAIIWMNVVWSFAILVLKALIKFQFHFLLSLPLNDIVHIYKQCKRILYCGYS